MRNVFLTPIDSLHTGVHGSLMSNPPPGVTYSSVAGDHCFVLSPPAECPYSSFPHIELIDVGQGKEIVHSARLPVLNRVSWVTDTDDLTIPLLCGRHAINGKFRSAYRSHPWSSEFRRTVRTRIQNMLFAYSHPSCKAVFVRGGSIGIETRRWLDEIGISQVHSRFWEKLRVLYPAQQCISSELFRLKWSLKARTIVFCGRDYGRKNGLLALRIMAKLRLVWPNIECVYIGHIGSDERRRWQSLLASIQYFESIPRGSVLEWFSRAHILLHPAQNEGLGTVFLEAAAAGMAVVVASGSGMAHTVEIFGERGALYVNRDEVPELEQEGLFEHHLRTLLSQPQQCAEMALHNYKATASGFLSVQNRDKTLLQAYEEGWDRPAGNALRLEDLSHPPSSSVIELDAETLRHLERTYWKEINLTVDGHVTVSF
ncbi:MAG TPA: glycosyltransferase [Acidisarcina sp.]